MKEPIIKLFDTSVYNDEKIFNEAYIKVSDERREKVDRYRFQKDKNLSLGAGILLEEGLQELGVENYFLRYGEHNKPYLGEYEDLFFSLSHSKAYAVCAFYNTEIGVDIEEISKVTEALMRRVTTDIEYAHLVSLDEKNKDKEFARLWTIKESYMKYLGTGLSLSPKRLEIAFGKNISIKQDGNSVNVTFKEFDVPGYKITVCY